MSAYDTLMENLPDYFKPVLEYIQIMQAHGYALDQLDNNIKSIYDNFYIQTADTETLQYYEKLLGIIPSPNDSLSYRKDKVIQQLSLVPQFDINWLITKLNSLYGENGYTLTVDPVSLSLNIDITDDRYDQVKLFYDFIWDVIPAHIYIPAKQYSGTSIDTPLCAGVVPSSTVMSYLTGTY